MKRIASIVLAAVLAACGGGGGGEGGNGGSSGTAAPPAAASASPQGFFDYLARQLGGGSESAEPVDVGGFVAPLSDSDEPGEV